MTAPLPSSPVSASEPMSLEKPDGWIVKNKYGAIELFLHHERAIDAFNAWGSFIGPVYQRTAGHAESPLEVRQHIAWLFQYVQGMNEQNWHDMKLRAERQLEQLSLAFPGPSDTSTLGNSQ